MKFILERDTRRRKTINILKSLTDKVATKKGASITVVLWLVLMIGISAGPKLGDYKVTISSPYLMKPNPLSHKIN